MSSRLNPRDYDLGELRDAVREAPRSRDDRRHLERRDVGRRDDHRPADHSTDAEPRDGVRTEGSERSQSGAKQPSEDRTNGRSPVGTGGSGEEATGDPSSDGQATTGSADQGGAGTRPADPAARGRPGRYASRFAPASSRDRTPDGEPRRRGSADGRPEGRRRSESRDGRHERKEPARGRGADAFELLSRGAGSDVERPYLDRLPDGYDAQAEIFEWLEGLLATCGREPTLDALAYYESVEWLSADSRERLEEFVEGLNAAEPPEPRSPDISDHRESLRYVARLAHRIDR